MYRIPLKYLCVKPFYNQQNCTYVKYPNVIFSILYVMETLKTYHNYWESLLLSFTQDSSKRNSGSSLFRRSGDFSRTPPVVFDNPAYRRSFELRPHRFNSWYDPEATDYDYSQNNANLINRKSRSTERRSLSASRLNDKRVSEHQRHGSSSSWHPSIHDYVPKVVHSKSEEVFSRNSSHHLHGSQNRLLQNDSNTPPNRRSFPRSHVENNRKYSNNREHFHHSYRSKSFDPDMSGGSSPWEETQFFTMDKNRSKSRYAKQNQSRKGTDRNRSEKISKRKRNNEIDRIYRTESEDKNNQFSNELPKNSNYKILSSNLQPVSFIYSGPTHDRRKSRSRSNSERSSDINDYYMNQDSSYRDWSSDNHRRYSSRQSSYRPENNEIYMFQTKL